ncbi:MAG TPA: hypothetical protein PKE04_01185 [Clostridia bacterium]|nr:hypothetical protein [Clostridia bacterium]
MQTNTYYDAFSLSDEEFSGRLRNLRHLMEQQGMDLFIAAGDEHYQGHVRYLSDYRPMLEYALVLVPAEAEAILLCGPQGAGRADIPYPEPARMLGRRHSRRGISQRVHVYPARGA